MKMIRIEKWNKQKTAMLLWERRTICHFMHDQVVAFYVNEIGSFHEELDWFELDFHRSCIIFMRVVDNHNRTKNEQQQQQRWWWWWR